MMKRSEASEQCALVEYCAYRNIPIFAIPNGGSRNYYEAVNLKRQGVKAGVPDLCVPVARRGYHGLYIEMKYGKNTTTPAQDDWLNLLNREGYLAKVCYGYLEAVDLLKYYFSEGDNAKGN